MHPAFFYLPLFIREIEKNDLPMIAANSISLVLLMIILYCEIRYR